ncbi:phosphonate ABC transporter, permease protein PhnE, partial [Janibacter corallicola]|uniref:phosphonate ABC transporter, permease protein PhnE n=1 Tax=Janibacter corallicola TaxID=415212 RepID=UPI000A06A884
MTAAPTRPRQGTHPEITLPRRPAPRPRSVAATFAILGLLAAGLWSVISLRINVATIIDSVDNAARFAERMFPLDFPTVGQTTGMVLETLAIVVLATALSVVLSVPLAIAAARATTRGRVSQSVARTVIVLARAVPDLVLAIVFLRLFGLGPAAGIAAMGLHSIGMVGKLYADAIEELDDGPRESIAAAGGDRRQQIWSAIPQALMPQVVATALHRFDINLRTSVLLGYVGVGGIGQAIADSLRTLDYHRGMALALLVLGLCIVVEALSGTIRAAIMRRSGAAVAGGTWVDRLFARRTPVQAAPVRQVQLSPPWT